MKSELSMKITSWRPGANLITSNITSFDANNYA